MDSAALVNDAELDQHVAGVLANVTAVESNVRRTSSRRGTRMAMAPKSPPAAPVQSSGGKEPRRRATARERVAQDMEESEANTLVKTRKRRRNEANGSGKDHDAHEGSTHADRVGGGSRHHPRGVEEEQQQEKRQRRIGRNSSKRVTDNDHSYDDWTSPSFVDVLALCGVELSSSLTSFHRVDCLQRFRIRLERFFHRHQSTSGDDDLAGRFLDKFEEYCEEQEGRFIQIMSPTLIKEPASQALHRASSGAAPDMMISQHVHHSVPGQGDSIVRVMLHIEPLQTRLAVSLLQRLCTYVVQQERRGNPRGKSANPQSTVSRRDGLGDVRRELSPQLPLGASLILTQLRLLETIYDGNAICDTVIEVLDACSPVVQRELLAAVPGIVDDAHQLAMISHLVSLVSSHEALTIQVLDTLSNLCISEGVCTNLVHTLLAKLWRYDLKELPVVVRFLLRMATTPDLAARITKELRQRLAFLGRGNGVVRGDDACETSPRGKDMSAPMDDLQGTALVMDAIRVAISFSPLMGKCLLDVVQASVDKGNASLVDMWMIYTLRACAVGSEKKVGKVFLKKIREGAFSSQLVRSSLTIYPSMVMSNECCLFDAAMCLARECVLGHQKRSSSSTGSRIARKGAAPMTASLRDFGFHMYEALFFDVACGQSSRKRGCIIDVVLDHVSSNVPGIVDMALRALYAWSCREPEALVPFVMYIKRLLDYITKFSAVHVRRIFSILGVIALPSESLMAGSDDAVIHIRRAGVAAASSPHPARAASVDDSDIDWDLDEPSANVGDVADIAKAPRLSEILMVMQKLIGNPEPALARIGVIVGVALLSELVPATSRVERGKVDYDPEVLRRQQLQQMQRRNDDAYPYNSGCDLVPCRLRSALLLLRQMLNFARDSVYVMAMLHDELSLYLSRGQIHVDLAAAIAKSASTYLFDNFVMETPPDGLKSNRVPGIVDSNVRVASCLSLGSEAQGGIVRVTDLAAHFDARVFVLPSIMQVLSCAVAALCQTGRFVVGESVSDASTAAAAAAAPCRDESLQEVCKRYACLSGLPLVLPSSRMLDTADTVPLPVQSVVLSSLYFATNWIREIVSASATEFQQFTGVVRARVADRNVRSLVIRRLDHLVRLEYEFKMCLDRVSDAAVLGVPQVVALQYGRSPKAKVQSNGWCGVKSPFPLRPLGRNVARLLLTFILAVDARVASDAGFVALPTGLYLNHPRRSDISEEEGNSDGDESEHGRSAPKSYNCGGRGANAEDMSTTQLPMSLSSAILIVRDLRASVQCALNEKKRRVASRRKQKKSNVDDLGGSRKVRAEVCSSDLSGGIGVVLQNRRVDTVAMSGPSSFLRYLCPIIHHLRMQVTSAAAALVRQRGKGTIHPFGSGESRSSGVDDDDEDNDDDHSNALPSDFDKNAHLDLLREIIVESLGCMYDVIASEAVKSGFLHPGVLKALVCAMSCADRTVMGVTQLECPSQSLDGGIDEQDMISSSAAGDDRFLDKLGELCASFHEFYSGLLAALTGFEDIVLLMEVVQGVMALYRRAVADLCVSEHCRIRALGRIAASESTASDVVGRVLMARFRNADGSNAKLRPTAVRYLVSYHVQWAKRPLEAIQRVVRSVAFALEVVIGGADGVAAGAAADGVVVSRRSLSSISTNSNACSRNEFPHVLSKRSVGAFLAPVLTELVFSLKSVNRSSLGTVSRVLQVYLEHAKFFADIAQLTKAATRKKVVLLALLKSGRQIVDFFISVSKYFSSNFERHPNKIVKILRRVQHGTRQMQAVCLAAKKGGSVFSSVLSVVPPAKRSMERFLYQTKQLLQEHKAGEVYSVNKLKARGLNGEVISDIDEQNADDDDDEILGGDDIDLQENEGAMYGEVGSDDGEDDDGEAESQFDPDGNGEDGETETEDEDMDDAGSKAE